MNLLSLSAVVALVVPTLTGCLPLSDSNLACGSGSSSSQSSQDCLVSLNVKLVDNHGEPVVASRLALASPSLLVTATDSNGQFTIANYNLGSEIHGNISNVVAPTGQSRFYLTSVSTASATNIAENGSLSSFGLGIDSNFPIQTALQNNILTVTYPRVVHYECAMPFNTTASLQCAGPMITASNVAQDFMLTSSENICRAGLQVTFSGFNSFGPPNPFSIHVRLRSDNNGAPGAIIADSASESTSWNNPQASVVGADSSGAGWGLTASYADFCANGQPKISLNAGQRYWLEMALVDVSMSYYPRFTILDMATCPLPSGGLPMQTSVDGVNWSPLTVSDPGGQGCGTSQNVPIFLSE